METQDHILQGGGCQLRFPKP